MPPLSRRALLLAAAPAPWQSLFDGKSLDGWAEAPFPGRGPVSVKDHQLILGKGRMTGVRYTRPFPTTNYEIQFEAARLDGKDFFAGLVFPIGDSHCSWINGGWDGATVGLSNLDGYDASENETSTPFDFANGRFYSFRLALTPQRLTASIDNRTVIDLPVPPHKFELRFDDTDLAKPLGFASYATTAALRNISWRTAAII